MDFIQEDKEHIIHTFIGSTDFTVQSLQTEKNVTFNINVIFYSEQI